MLLDQDNDVQRSQPIQRTLAVGKAYQGKMIKICGAKKQPDYEEMNQSKGQGIATVEAYQKEQS